MIDVIGKKALVLVEAKDAEIENKVENEKEFSLTPPLEVFEIRKPKAQLNTMEKIMSQT